MRTCPHLDNGNCKVAMILTKGIPAPITSQSCGICMSLERPMTLNIMTCQLAYAVTRDPEIKAAFSKEQTRAINRPGTCLRNILHKLNLSEKKECKCDEYAAIMDTWGTEGCRSRIPEIVDHLNSQTVTWLDMAKVVMGGYFTTEALVLEAIRQSEQGTKHHEG